MAIVFDTQAELEAFCDMFELKSFEATRQNRKLRRKSSQPAQATETMRPDVMEPDVPQPFYILPVNEPEAAESQTEHVMAEPTVTLASAS